MDYSTWYDEIKKTDSPYNDDHGRTVLTPEKISAVVKLSLERNGLQGDVAEVGVWRGGVGHVLGRVFTNQNIYLFDTWTGIPYSSKHDNVHIPGHFSDVDFEDVKQYLSSFKNIKLYRGVFPQETAHFIEDKKFCVVHLDVDVYQSYYECLDFFVPRMVRGGIIMLDDYDIKSCHGATAACNQQAERLGFKIEKDLDGHQFIINF